MNERRRRGAGKLTEDDQELLAVRAAVAAGHIHWQVHALERLLLRGITRAEVFEALLHGVVIERDSERRPLPTILILHVQQHPLHVVVAPDVAAGACNVITVYRPDLDHFEPDFTRRRRRP